MILSMKKSREQNKECSPDWLTDTDPGICAIIFGLYNTDSMHTSPLDINCRFDNRNRKDIQFI